jgi:hypothetical protein
MDRKGAEMLYLLDLPIVTLAFRDNHHAATTIPAGSIVEVVRPDVDDRFLLVRVFQEELLIFAADLNDRSTPVSQDPGTVSTGLQHQE